MLEEMKDRIKAKFSGVLLFVVIFILGIAVFIGIPILIGSLFLFIWEYCLCMTTNWSWISRWLYGLVGIGLPLFFTAMRGWLKD